MTLEIGSILIRSNYVWKWRDNYVLFLFVIATKFLLRYNYVICLFDVVTFFDDIRNRFYFGIIESQMETTLQLRFVFVCHCNVYFGLFELRMVMTWQLRFIFVFHCEKFFIALQLRYLFVRCSYVFRWR